MGRSDTLDASCRDAKRKGAVSALATALLATFATAASGPAFAQYGCLVLLCLAAPDWRAIPQCVPPISKLLDDLAHGRPFPTCPMAGAGNSASHQWAPAPGNCPPQYTHMWELEGGGPRYACEYTGVVSVTIDGAQWARTWWRFRGGTVTEFTPAAKAQLGTWNTRFDDDYAAWLASQPSAPSCTDC